MIDNRKEYLPDLVKPILQDHVLPLLENETEEEKKKRLEFYIEAKGKINGMTTSELTIFRRHLRELKTSGHRRYFQSSYEIDLNLVGEKVCLFVNLAIFRFQTLEMKEIFSSGKRFLPKHRG